jgi:hypothetical protein
LQYTLPEQLTAAELQDLLLIAVNLPHAQPAATILRFDDQHQLLLHATGNDASNSTSDGSSSSNTVQLVEHLITTAIIRGHWRIAALLADTPAAQQLGSAAVAQLLHLCIPLERVHLPAQQFDEDEDNVFGFNQGQPPELEDMAPCFSMLFMLPAVQDLSASTVASLLRLAVKQQQFQLAKALAALPAAQQLPSQELCELLLMLLMLPRNEDEQQRQLRQRKRLIIQLSELQSAQHLAPGAMLQLLSVVLLQPPPDRSGFTSASNPGGPAALYAPQLYHRTPLGLLFAMDIGSQLTAVELLQLLQLAAEQGGTATVGELARLAPARNIDDVDGFAAFLRAAIAQGIASGDLTYTVESLPVLQQLGADAVHELISMGLAGPRHDRLSSGLLQHPAVSSFSTVMLEQLLLKAAKKRCLTDVAPLLKGPAAAGLSEEAVAELLQHAAWEMAPRDFRLPDDCQRQQSALEAMHPSLLELPAAQQLSADAVLSVLTAAVESVPENVFGVRRVCALPGARQISTEAALKLLKRAASLNQAAMSWHAIRSSLPQLAALPAELLQLTSEQLVEILPGALKAGDSEALSVLCSLAAEAENAAEAALSIRAEHMETLLTVALQ